MHLAITSGDWLSIKNPIMNKMGTKIELRLASSTESQMQDRKAAAEIPNQPGRAMQPGGRHMLIGAPVAGPGRHIIAADGEDGAMSEQEAVVATAAEIAGAWQARGVVAAWAGCMYCPPRSASPSLRAPRGTLRLGVGERGMDTVDQSHRRPALSGGRCRRVRAQHRAQNGDHRDQGNLHPGGGVSLVFDVGMGLIDAYDPDYVRVYQNNLSTIAAVTDELAKKLHQRRPRRG